MTNVSDETRRQLAQWARHRKTRNANWTSEKPTDWNPNSVRNPLSEMGLTFTNPEAWEFVATKLEDGHPIKVVQLVREPGRDALVMNIDLGEGIPSLYVKLQPQSGRIFGWSFHYSEYN